MAKALRIGLLGFGVVGGGVYKALQESADLIAERCGRPASIKRALVRDVAKTRSAAVEPALLTTDPEAVLDDPEIEAVVEVLGGEEPAFAYARRALRNGKHLVTANKEMLAKHGEALFRLAREHNAHLGFEASVGGGIPIIAALRDDLAANRIQSVAGIVNGTTNYLLTEMEDKGRDFATALREAQALGYAEPDPTNDVEGFDARYKLVILSALAFGAWLTPDDVPCRGITGLDAIDFSLARDLGYSIKLLATGRRNGGAVEAAVQPALVPLGGTLAGVKGVFNAVRVRGDLVGDLVYIGRGAGPGPTASAILADLVAVATGAARPLPASRAAASIAPADEASGRYYLRLAAGTGASEAAVARLGELELGVGSGNTATRPGMVAVLTGVTTRGAIARAAASLAATSLARLDAVMPVAE